MWTRVALVFLGLVGGCREPARPSAAPTVPAPQPMTPPPGRPEVEDDLDDLDEDDMLALVQQIKRIGREGPLTQERERALRAAAVQGPAYQDLVANPANYIGRPYRALGRVLELRPGPDGFTALVALGPGQRRPLAVSGAFALPDGIRAGRRAEALGYLGGTLLYPAAGRGPQEVPALAAVTVRPVP
ncbi:MAG: hypothetical protein RMK29_00500 [Myxococcales bacterium]|nr:hypothetical protein [Myxococcota bacterium]MDW8280156.1 hypothetical protein [Myxococcales bacterium]